MSKNPEPGQTKNPQAVPRGHEPFNEVIAAGVKRLALAPGAPEAVQQMECRRFRRTSSVSELTTRPRLGEDCWSRDALVILAVHIA